MDRAERGGSSGDDAANNSDSAASRVPQERTPLPIKQLLVIATVLLSEPLTNSVLRAFDDASNAAVNPTVQVFNMRRDDDMFSNLYSRLLESSLFLAKAATVYQWGRLSDKLGRRPILLIGPFGLGLSTWVLGLTNNAWIQTAARSMQGVFGGNLETTKTVIAEVTDASNRHRAYAAIPFVQSVGVSIGLSIGNLLATLPENFPFFNNVSFITTHPRFIPCSIAAAFSFFAFHVLYHAFEETLPPEFQIDWKVLWNLKDRVQVTAASAIPSSTTALLDQARDLGYTTFNRVHDAAENAINTVQEEVTERVNAMVPTEEIKGLRELIEPQLIIALSNYACISFLDQAQQTLVPLVYTSPVDQGGLGVTPDEMTTIMGRWGSYNTLGQLWLFPQLLQRYGPKKVYATCLSSMVAFFALIPVLFALKTWLADITSLLSLHMALTSFVYMAYGSAQLLIMDVISDKRSMGSVNGIAQSVGSSARMLVPPLLSIFFSMAGTGDGAIGGFSLYAFLVLVTVIGMVMSSLLPQTLTQ